MATAIETTIPGRRITAGPTELHIENTNTGGMIWARLLNDDAKKVADALIGRKPDDPCEDCSLNDETVRRIKAHHHADEMKRERDAAVSRADEWKQKARQYSDKFNRARSFNAETKARAARAERERDQLQGRVLYLEKMDAAKEARLAYLTRNRESEVDALRESYGERVREANARADAAEAKVRELEHDRNLWRERAENGEPRPEVTKDDVEKAVRSCPTMGAWNGSRVETEAAIDAVWSLVSGDDPAVFVVRESDIAAVDPDRAERPEAPTVSRADIEKAILDNEYSVNDDGCLHHEVNISAATDAVCDLLGVEAEQTIDPVEEQTDALADILYGDELVTDRMRGVLERVVRAGMLLPEQDADR